MGPDGEPTRLESFTVGADTTSAWSVIRSSELWEGLDIAGEHYHPSKLYALSALERVSAQKISDFFDNVRNIYDPSRTSTLPQNARTFDLTDALGNHLKEGWPVSSVAEVGSNKKIAQPGDVIIARLRSYLREIAVVPHNTGITYLLSTEFIVLRNKFDRHNGRFLLPYLLSDSIQTILQWSQDGSNHPRFADSLLMNLPLPKALIQNQGKLNSLVDKANQNFQRSRSLYFHAENLLLESLGLANLNEEKESTKLDDSLTYTVLAGEVFSTRRLDAEFYQQKFRHIMESISRSGKILSDIAQLAKRKFQPQPGKTFQYIEISDLDQSGYADSSTIWGEDAPSRAQWIVNSDDVITSTVRPIRRLSALIEPEQHGFVCSSGFAVLQSTSIEPEVLLVYLRLAPISEILDLYTSASMYPAIATTDLLKLPVAIPPDAVRAKIVELIRESRNDRREFFRLLTEAKRYVESLIQGKEDYVAQ